jgi:hypothetical protein
MNRPLIAVLMFIALIGLLVAAGSNPASARQQPLPAGHPPIEPQLPPGHPPLNPQLPPGHPPMNGGGMQVPHGHPSIDPAPPPADPQDVLSAEAIVSAYYDSVSGGKGVARDWERFRSLFIPEARLIAAQPLGPSAPCAVLTPQQFAQMNDTYFERGGYFERDIERRIETFGHMAHVFSTYEARRAESDEEPYSRGINSFQLVFDSERWWIGTVMWDYERPGNAIPAEYLPAAMDE